jgi:hypothetical protein
VPPPATSTLRIADGALPIATRLTFQPFAALVNKTNRPRIADADVGEIDRTARRARVPGIAPRRRLRGEAGPTLTKSRRVRIDSEFMSNPLWCGASADARYGRVRLPGAACHGLRCTIPIEHRSERGAEQARATASRLNRESSGAQSRPCRVATANDATPVASLAGVGLFAETVARRIAVVPLSDAGPALASVAVIFEAVPEVLDLKRDASARASVLAGPKPIIASPPRP